MKQIKVFPTISYEDAIYIAGFIDGEGCIAISDSKSTSGKPNHALRLILGNTHEGIMKWYAETIGGTLKFRDHSAKKLGANWWEVVVSSNHAAHVLKFIAPYLKVKRPQAEIGIAFQEFILERGGQGRPLTDEDIKAREEFKQLLLKIREDDKQYSLAA